VASSDKLLLRLAFFAVLFTGIWFIFSLNSSFSEVTPTHGGSITEGILGTPRYVNPALAIARADQDVAALIYSGLLKISSDGDLVNDLAESIQISEDGLTYTISLRRDARFHDGTPVTARDVAYTIRLIQDPNLKSPLRGNWAGVMLEEIDEYTFTVTLEESYAPFIENFTLGIMPAHAWSKLTIEKLPFSQLNTEPIGSGPFAVEEVVRDTSGLVSSYVLRSVDDHIQDPKIEEIILVFYESEETLVTALKEKEIDATTYVPQSLINEVLTDDYNLIIEPLPRTFGIFLNQNKSTVLRDANVREALDLALDKNKIIEEVFYGFGVPIYGPTTFRLPGIESPDGTLDNATTTPIGLASELLEDSGWTKNEQGIWENEIDDETVTLSLTLRTSNAPLFNNLSTLIAEVCRSWVWK